MSRMISAAPEPKDSVIYTDDNGGRFSYSGGTRTWRNSNPGNLVPGKVSRRHGQIGVAAKFAVFPDYESGHEALIDCLKTTYADSTISGLVKGYAPKGENNVKRYTAFLRKQTGVRDGRKVRRFSDAEFEKLWRAIEKMEGYKAGKITPLPPLREITKVSKNKKGTIIAYFVPGMGWISKEQGIQLTQAGKIDAVVTTSRSGNLFLRTRPDVTIVNNLDRLG